MIDSNIQVEDDTYRVVESLYRQFCAEKKNVARENKSADERTRKAAYGKLYDKYQAAVMKACSGNIRVAANAAITISLNHSSWDRRFPWIVAGAGIVQNIQQVDITLPERNDAGELDYLGRKYKMVIIPKEEVKFD